MYDEDELRPISALQHLVYCERQCALIHLEQQWAENRYTAEGKLLHERVDEPGGARRGDVRVVRSLALRSLRLGLVGRADAVELRRVEVEGGDAPLGLVLPGVVLPGLDGRWRPFPIEYKRGRPKKHRADEVQLCAQALCLEEMLEARIERGALFYGQRRRRHPVVFDAELRALTERTAARLHEVLSSGRTPPPEPGPKCRRCSLRDVCLPEAPRVSARGYLEAVFATMEEG